MIKRILLAKLTPSLFLGLFLKNSWIAVKFYTNFYKVKLTSARFSSAIRKEFVSTNSIVGFKFRNYKSSLIFEINFNITGYIVI